MSSKPVKTKEQIEAEAEKRKLMEEYRHELYQTTASGLPDPLILLLILTNRYHTLKQEYDIEKEDAKEIKNNIGIDKVFGEGVTPKQANALINMIYNFNTGNMLLRITNQLAELLQFQSQQNHILQKLTIDINQLKNGLNNESKVEEKKTTKTKKKVTKTKSKKKVEE